MVSDGVTFEVQSQRVSVRRACAGRLPAEVDERLEPARVDTCQGVVGEVQAVEVRQRVEDASWDPSVGELVAIQ